MKTIEEGRYDQESFSYNITRINRMRTTMIAALTTRCWYILDKYKSKIKDMIRPIFDISWISA